MCGLWCLVMLQLYIGTGVSVLRWSGVECAARRDHVPRDASGCRGPSGRARRTWDEVRGCQRVRYFFSHVRSTTVVCVSPVRMYLVRRRHSAPQPCPPARLEACHRATPRDRLWHIGLQVYSAKKPVNFGPRFTHLPARNSSSL